MRQGRFNKQVAEVAQRYSESVSFDWRLYPYDIAGSIAHAVALGQAGILTADEPKKIDNGLREIEAEIESGKFEWDQSLEDMHMNIEAALTKRIGAGSETSHRAQPERSGRARSAALRQSRDCGAECRTSLVADRIARSCAATRRCCHAGLYPLATCSASFSRALFAGAN